MRPNKKISFTDLPAPFFVAALHFPEFHSILLEPIVLSQ
jgi:hypothetical protein